MEPLVQSSRGALSSSVSICEAVAGSPVNCLPHRCTASCRVFDFCICACDRLNSESILIELTSALQLQSNWRLRQRLAFCASGRPVCIISNCPTLHENALVKSQSGLPPNGMQLTKRTNSMMTQQCSATWMRISCESNNRWRIRTTNVPATCANSQRYQVMNQFTISSSTFGSSHSHTASRRYQVVTATDHRTAGAGNDKRPDAQRCEQARKRSFSSGRSLSMVRAVDRSLNSQDNSSERNAAPRLATSPQCAFSLSLLAQHIFNQKLQCPPDFAAVRQASSAVTREEN